jgi:hypothetical protein
MAACLARSCARTLRSRGKTYAAPLLDWGFVAVRSTATGSESALTLPGRVERRTTPAPGATGTDRPTPSTTPFSEFRFASGIARIVAARSGRDDQRGALRLFPRANGYSADARVAAPIGSMTPQRRSTRAHPLRRQRVHDGNLSATGVPRSRAASGWAETALQCHQTETRRSRSTPRSVPWRAFRARRASSSDCPLSRSCRCRWS